MQNNIKNKNQSKENKSTKKKKIVTSYFKTKNSYLTINNNSILVMSSKYPTKSPSAIKISKSLDIELGRDIEQFNSLLIKTRIPILFEKLNLIGKNNTIMYSILRMQTDEVGDEVLGNIVCDSNGIIQKLICTKTFKKEEDYLTYEELGSLWKIRSIKEESKDKNIKKLEYLVKAISDFDLLTDASINTEEIDNGFEVKVKSLEMNYNYIFMLNSITNKYELVTVCI